MQSIILLISLVSPSTIILYIFKKIKFSFTFFEMMAISIFLGQLLLVSLLFIFSLAFGFSNLIILITLSLLFVISIIIIRGQKQYFLSLGGNLKKDINKNLYVFITLIIFELIFFILLKQVLFEEKGELYTNRITYGDLPYHLSMITTIATGNNFPPENPIFSGIRLSYPFLVNFHSAIFYKLGFTLSNSLLLPSLIYGFTLFSLFIAFSKRFIKGNLVAIMALFVFLLNGGLGGFYILKDALHEKNFLPGLEMAFGEDIGVGKYNIIFTNNLSSVLLAQRSLPIGLSSFFVILLLLWIACIQKGANKELILAGLVAGLLPLWHTHTLIGLFLMIPVYIACLSIKQKSLTKGIKYFLPFLYFSVPLATLGMHWHFQQISSSSHFFSINIGWIVGKEGLLKFWLNNLSLFIILLPIGLFLLNKNQILFYLSISVIFLTIHLFQFQPLVYDNYKLAMLWHAVSAIIVANVFIHLFKFKLFGKIVSLSSFLILILSGFILVFASYTTSYKLFTTEDIRLANWTRINIPTNNIILSGQQHNQFLVLAGRKILLGYPGYLWTQGINYSKREQDLKSIYQGNEQLMKEYKIDYIVIGPNEKDVYQADINYFDTNYSLIQQTTNYKIYKIN